MAASIGDLKAMSSPVPLCDVTTQIAHLLETTTYGEYPREAVREVLASWKVD